MSLISDECPDCGAHYMVMGFACQHERCPIFSTENVGDTDPLCTNCYGSGIDGQTEWRCACQPPELKRGEVLSFDDGTLTINIAGHGKQNGWGSLAFHEAQFELDADGFQVVEIPPSELRAIRDFLNRVIPQ